MVYKGPLDSYFELTKVDAQNYHILHKTNKSELLLLWFTAEGSRLNIDGHPVDFQKDEIISLTEFHKVDASQINEAQLIRFNRAFYCIVDHDSEVGCKGVLYYGSSELPRVTMNGQNLEILQTAWRMLHIEMNLQDSLQQEMLQMMLKRILIHVTRVYKEGAAYSDMKSESVDLIRQFNFLVERHFKKHHEVTSYARMLHKSPKTLANSFKKLDRRSPSQFIKDRLILEARRMLLYTDYNVSEISDELGFSDVHSFSRFFKSQNGIAPSEFQESHKGIIAKPTGTIA